MSIIESAEVLSDPRKDRRRQARHRKYGRRQQDIEQHIRRLRSERRAIATLIERLPYGIILIGGDGKPVRSNRKAQAMLKKQDRLWLTQGGFTASSPEETKALRELVDEVISSAPQDYDPEQEALELGRSFKLKSLHLLVAPIAADLDDSELGEVRICAVMFISLPDHAQLLPIHLLGLLFSLTPAEARLLGAIANAKTIEQITKEFNISRHTARSQLQKIFEKTGTSRQAQLVKLVLSSPAPLLGQD